MLGHGASDLIDTETSPNQLRDLDFLQDCVGEGLVSLEGLSDSILGRVPAQGFAQHGGFPLEEAEAEKETSFRTPRGMLHREQVFVPSPVFDDRSLLGEVAVDDGEQAFDFQGDRAIRGV